MTKVLLIKDKWDTYIKGPYETKEELEEGARKLIGERLADGFWYIGEEDMMLAVACRDGNPPKGWSAVKFLERRSDYEYEYVEVQTITR